MTWAILVPLIAQVGLPLALKLADLYANKPNEEPTPEQWDMLKTHIPFDQMVPK